MNILAAMIGPAILVLAAAPGEAPVAEHEVPEAARAAVIRRLDNDATLSFRRILVKHSERMPGYVVCGEVARQQAADSERFERFFVVVPGTFAVLERDGAELIDRYWKLNGC
jgi:hypothetical protein